MWLGVSMFRSRTEVVHQGRDVRYGAVTAGIMMSALNPFFLLWWATTGLMLVMRVADYGALALVPFTLVHWGCDLVWLTFVSVLIYKTRTLWGSRFQEWLFILTSLALLYFGGWFIYSGIQQAVQSS
jgi:threonine/homoserine/homoserine lactone efflux protein